MIHSLLRVVILLSLHEGCHVKADSCSCPNPPTSSTSGFTSVDYLQQYNDVDVINPGRGMYHMVEANTSNFKPLNSHSLNSKLNIILRLYYLDSYVTDDMHGDFTTKVKNDLAFAQSHGWTVVLRFAYIENCPFNDATLAQMLRHIKKLNEYNVFKDYSVVIAAIQAGFIGRYGEWHYWDEHHPCPNKDFGEANGCSDTFGLHDTQWRARRQIIDALLNASPKSVDILVRVPFYKYHEFGKNPTTLDEDRAETDASRIGYHNDALLSDYQDQGTFKCPGDRIYMHEDTKYNFVIGETNDPTHHSEYACPKAMTDLKYFHYSSVHEDYEENVIQYWKDNGCYSEIAARLGYRLYIKNDTDDNSLYGYTENFDTSTTPEVWHLKELHVVNSKSIKTATCYAMFRNGQGYVYFDNFRLNTCAGQSCRYQTADGSFEVGDGWVNYQDGFKRHHGNAQNGNYFITVTNGGATQYIDFNSGSITRFTLSGYSRAHSVTGISDSDYSIYCDLTHPNHDNTWGEHANFDPSQSSWHHAILNVVSSKVILGARCYAMFRNGHGSADFDNFQLESCE